MPNIDRILASASQSPKIAFDSLPADDGSLFLIGSDEGTDYGIGTADEIRGLVADTILPASILMQLVPNTATA